MPLTTYFGKNAFCHLTESLALSPDEIIEIMDTGKASRLGTDEETGKCAWLFYSDVDHRCFMAIRDEGTSEVIKILPALKYNRIRLSYEIMEKARRLALALPQSAISTAPVVPQQPCQRYLFILKITTRMGNEKYDHFKWPVKDVGASIEDLQADREIHRALGDWVAETLNPLDEIVSIFVRLGVSRKKNRPSLGQFHLQH